MPNALPVLDLEFDSTRAQLIRDAALDDLADPHYIEHTLMPQLGFTPESPFAMPEVTKANVGGLLIWQYPNQFAKYLSVIRRLNIHSYIEIGCRWGGTFILTVEYLQRFGLLTRGPAVAVDIIESPVLEYTREHSDAGVFAMADSHSAGFAEWVQDKHFDLVFIDGDHSYEGVKADFEVMEKHGSVFVFHDITNVVVPGVARFWMELKAMRGGRFEFVEILDQYEDVQQGRWQPYLGMGIAIPKA